MAQSRRMNRGSAIVLTREYFVPTQEFQKFFGILIFVPRTQSGGERSFLGADVAPEIVAAMLLASLWVQLLMNPGGLE
jgi:uncharacterized membrane protein